jgi:RNA polymerase sigma factor (sigma-70 family)
MVREVCGRIVGQDSDADDAFQATFLLLVQKARSIRKQASVGSWLYGVATRVAWNARTRTERARLRKSRPEGRTVPDPAQEAAWRELLAVVDDEVVCLPEKYRGPVVLCYLEGQTQDEAARQLGWSLRTLKRRLERGRELLRLRLKRRGLTLSAALLATGLTLNPARALPPLMARLTTQLAGMLARGAPVTTTASASVASLVGQVSRSLVLVRAGFVATWLLAGLAVAGFLVPQLFRDKAGPQVAQTPETPPARNANEPRAESAHPPRTDADGEPLPAGALRRLGSLRFRHTGSLESLLPLPDGKTLLSNFHADRAVSVWDLATGKLQRRFPGNQDCKQIAVTADGKTLAAGQGDVIHLWDLASGREIQQIPSGHQEVLGLAFMPDGKTLASAGLNQTIRLWDLASGREKSRLAVELPQVLFLYVTPDGQTLIAGDERERAIFLFDVKTGRMVHRLQSAVATYTIALSPDGHTLATGSHNGTVPLWDTATGKPLGAVQAGQRLITTTAFSPDGKTLAWAEGDGWGADACIRLWNLAASKEVACLKQHAIWIDCLSFSQDGRSLFAGYKDGTIGRWSLATGKELPLPGVNRGLVGSVSLSPDSRILATRTAFDIRLWDLATGQDLGAFPGYQRGMEAVTFAPDGRNVALGGRDHTVSLWDIPSRRLIRRLVPKDKPDPQALGYTPPDTSLLEVITCIAFSADGKKLAVGGKDTIIRIWDRESGTEGRRITWPQTMIEKVALSPDGKVLAALSRSPSRLGRWESTVCFWDVATGKELSRLNAAMNAPRDRYAGHDAARNVGPGLMFSPDGRLMVILRRGKVLPVWEWAAGKVCLQLRGHDDSITTAAFSPNSRMLATASWDNTIRLWDLANGEQMGQVAGHRGKAASLAFSADGKVLVSGGEDTTVLVWDVERITRRNEPRP